MTNHFNGDFLREIKGEHETIRNHRVGVYLDVAASFDGSEANDGKLQQNYIDAALKLNPNEFETVLREKLSNHDAPLAGRANAASLFLRGHELKLWPMSPKTGRLARRLVRNFKEDSPGSAEPAEVFHGRLRIAIVDDNGILTTIENPDQQKIRDFYIGAASNPKLNAYDRLFCQCMVLEGALKKLWTIPEGWNPGISK